MGDAAYSTGISVKFGVDLSGLTSGIANAKEMLSGFVDEASGLASIFDGALSGLSSLGGGANEAVSELADLGDIGEDAGEKLVEAGSGAATFTESLGMIGTSLQELGSNIGGVVSGRFIFSCIRHSKRSIQYWKCSFRTIQ